MALGPQDLTVISNLISQATAGGGANLVQQDFGPLFSQYKITYGTALEFIADSLYDTQTYPPAGATILTFFQTQFTLGNLALTNMPLAGMLPDRQGFLVMSIRTFFVAHPTVMAPVAAPAVQVTASNDLLNLISNGVLALNFLNKDYGKFPAWLLPAGGGVYSSLATAGIAAPGAVIDTANNGYPDARNIYVLEQPLFLPPMTKLGVTANFGPTPPVVQVATPIKVLFDGLMVRPIQ